MAQPDADAQAAAGGAEFALFAVGAGQMGVPSHNVVQAIAYPQQLTHLPRARQALAGVFTHRGQVLPLIDLQRWMAMADGTPAAAPPLSAPTAATAGTARQVLVLQAEGKLLAVCIDALGGLLRAPASDVQRLHHDDDGEELFHSVLRGADGVTLTSLLDPLRLARQAQVWARADAGSLTDTVTATAPGAPAQQPPPDGGGPQSAGPPALRSGLASASTSTSLSCAVVRLGQTLVALPAASVGQVLSGLPLQKMGGLGSDFLGMGRWRGLDLPVLDLAQLLGLPSPSEPQAPWLLVLHQEERVLAFPVHEIRAVRSLDSAALQSSAGLSPRMQTCCQGSCLSESGERIYLLQPQALLDASPLSNTARRAAQQTTSAAPRLGYQRQTSASASAGAGAGAEAGALVVFRSRQLWAAPMGLMREIVRLPPGLQRAAGASEALPAAMEWRGQALALLDLRQTLDDQASTLGEGARIIVTQSGTRSVGLLVEGVVALIPGHAGTRARFSASGTTVDMVTVGSGAQQASYQLMDLSRLAVFAQA